MFQNWEQMQGETNQSACQEGNVPHLKLVIIYIVITVWGGRCLCNCNSMPCSCMCVRVCVCTELRSHVASLWWVYDEPVNCHQQQWLSRDRNCPKTSISLDEPLRCNPTHPGVPAPWWHLGRWCFSIVTPDRVYLNNPTEMIGVSCRCS